MTGEGSSTLDVGSGRGAGLLNLARLRLRRHFVSVAIGVIALGLVFELGRDALERHRQQVARQDMAMHMATETVSRRVAHHIHDIGVTLKLFADANVDVLAALKRHPNDAGAFADLETRLRQYFPQLQGLTLTDPQGNILYDDFGERVGALCLSDIRTFSSGRGAYLPHIHPGPANFHFDLMVGWGVGERRGTLFMSLGPEEVAHILREEERDGFRLLVTRADDPALIEVSAAGSRDRLAGEGRLSPDDLARVSHVQPVPGTRWQAVALPDGERAAGQVRHALGDWTMHSLIVLSLAIFLIVLNERGRGRRAAVEQHLRKLSMAVEQTEDAVGITDCDGRIEYVNRAFERMTGYAADEVLGKTYAILCSGRYPESFYRDMWTALARGDSFQEVLINRRKTGELYYEEKTISPLKDAFGQVTHFVSTGKDITDQMAVRERLNYLAHHDPLTSLPNRALFRDRLEHAMVAARRHGGLIGLLFIDLDNFKTVNDTLGHAEGDALLTSVAGRLRASVRESDTVARLGGDEFTVIVEGASDPGDVARVAQTILDGLARPLELAGEEMFVTASIGITLYPNDGEDVGSLCRNADAAMYRAKDEGRNAFRFFTHDLSERAVKRMNLENRLRHALERSEFRLQFQPKVSLTDERTSGMEALLRWHSPELGLVPPDQFIPVLESTGQIVEVGDWVLSEACRFAAELRRAGHDLSVAVNLSARQILVPDLPLRVQSLLAIHGLPAEALELEITETLLIENLNEAITVLGRIGALGVRISMDDFGTGYSSLSYLKRLPIHNLKIDRSFVCELPGAQEDSMIIAAILAMARSLGLNVVAEGVETAEQAVFLRELGCDQAQGYFYSRPLTNDDFIAWLARNDNGSLHGE